ncbi:hypothetical protein RJ640_006982 [Escallonia rubra]|uniref:Cytochrome P450 n=1 Tax=Escallonia rubra TaxID=112253 RepID=A0AA88RLE3_9ASTE|nr:hypothetical protein RJ640_006982 [Escallonia rubra]
MLHRDTQVFLTLICLTDVSFYSWLLRSADDIESEKLEQGIRKPIIRMIKKREKAMNGKVDSFGNDFLGLLVKANHDSDEGNRITEDDVVDECKTFYIAGHETTTSLLTWTVLLLETIQIGKKRQGRRCSISLAMNTRIQMAYPG